MYRCKSWTIKKAGLKNWCFQTVVLEKTLESPLDSKEIKLVNLRWHHWLNGHAFEQTLGDSEGQESWHAAVHVTAESDMTEWLNNNLNIIKVIYDKSIFNIIFNNEKQSIFWKIRNKTNKPNLTAFIHICNWITYVIESLSHNNQTI